MGSTPHFGLGNRTLSLSTCSLPIKQVGMFSFAMSLFAFVIIHQGHERKEINLCLAAFIGHRLRIEITFRRENFTTILRTDGFEALGAVDFAIKQVGKYFSTVNAKPTKSLKFTILERANCLTIFCKHFRGKKIQSGTGQKFFFSGEIEFGAYIN